MIDDKDFATYYCGEFPIMDDNQKPAEPSYYVCKRTFTHEPVCFVKCHFPDDLNRWQQNEGGVHMYHVSTMFGAKGVPHPKDGYYVLCERKQNAMGFDTDNPTLYFERLATDAECVSFSALLKLSYHNLFD